METPNTRARRKRELREIEERGSGVGWQLDERMRNELLMHAADDPIPLPTPTQRPMPIGSASFSGDRPVLKRPRRLVRGARSNPTPSTERTRLDDLLDKLEDHSARSTPTFPTPISRPDTAYTSTGSTSRSTLGTSRAAGGRSAPARILADRTNAKPVAASTSLPASKGASAAQPLRATKSAPRPVAQLASERPVRSSPRRAPPPRPEAASPLAMRGAAPAPANGRGSAAPNGRGMSRVLSTPVRQSPRTAVAPRAATMSTRSTPLRSTRSASVVSAQTPLPAQPSSDGDTSIDSLDMAFECGGEDIDRLFQVMDSGR